jgi:plastocyanin
MRALVAVTLAAVSVGLLGARADAGAQATRLIGTVNSAMQIGLTDENGAPVTTIPPGDYEIEVRDTATFHNFHLTGPGVDKATSVTGTETVTWSLTLADGAYHFQCDPHYYAMYGDFTVGTAPPPPPPGPPPPAPPPPLPPPAPPPPGPPPPPPTAPPPPPRAPAATVGKLSVRMAPGRVVVASLTSSAPARATMELRRKARIVQSKKVALKAGRNTVRMRIRAGVPPGRYLLVLRTTTGRRVSHLLRLR